MTSLWRFSKYLDKRIKVILVYTWGRPKDIVDDAKGNSIKKSISSCLGRIASSMKVAYERTSRYHFSLPVGLQVEGMLLGF